MKSLITKTGTNEINNNEFISIEELERKKKEHEWLEQ